jgi:hypothetical protein
VPDHFLTIAEVARQANVTARTVSRDINSGALPVIRRNARVLRIALKDALAYRQAPRSLLELAGQVPAARLVYAEAKKRNVALRPGQGFLSPRQIAAIAGKPIRSIYHDIKEGVFGFQQGEEWLDGVVRARSGPAMRPILRVDIEAVATYLDLLKK